MIDRTPKRMWPRAVTTRAPQPEPKAYSGWSVLRHDGTATWLTVEDIQRMKDRIQGKGPGAA